MTKYFSLPEDLAFYITPPHPCSYISEREAITLFADPYATLDMASYDQLARMGFRRSGNHVYRPQCEQCTACISARIPVEHFEPNRSQKRTWRRNADIDVRLVGQGVHEEHFALYQRYLSTRHPDSSMAVDDAEQYGNFLTSTWCNTEFAEFRGRDGRLLGVAVVDWMASGISAVYTFFDPAEAERGIGVYAILWQVEEARRRGLPYVYLGYLIEEVPQMAYKAAYRPLEVFVKGGWLNYHSIRAAMAEE